jgi:tRNA dimethylallyltransferase
MKGQNTKKAIVVLGPTSTGKTDLALNLARQFNGELISCDSRQVYKGLDIGTGKMPSFSSKQMAIERDDGYWNLDGIKIWMYDVVDPNEQFDVVQYEQKTRVALEKIYESGKLPTISPKRGEILYPIKIAGTDDTIGPITGTISIIPAKIASGKAYGIFKSSSPI